MSRLLSTTVWLAGLCPLWLASPAAAGEIWAVVIGVDRYEHLGPEDQLRYCARDANLFKDTLIDHGRLSPQTHLQLFCRGSVAAQQPTYKNLVDSIPDFLKQVGQDDTVVFYFSGHGFLGIDGACYLAPQDCRPDRLDSTGLRLDWVRRQLEDCPAKLRLMFIDACYSGNPVGNTPSATGTALERVLRDSPSIYTIASCDAAERSLEWPEKQHGVFTYWLCRGLQGAADRDGDARISLDELYSFVLSRVPRTARRLSEQNGRQETQTPVRFLGGNQLGVPVLELPEEPPARALERVAELLDDLIRDEYPDAERRRVGVLEFSNRVGDDEELRGRLGTFGVLAAERVQDRLLELRDGSYVVQGRRFLANFVADIAPKFGVKDLTERLDEIAERKNHPETLIVGSFQRRTNPDRLHLTCDLLDVAGGVIAAKVSATMLVDAELWTMLGGSVELPAQRPGPAPVNRARPKRPTAAELTQHVAQIHPLLDPFAPPSPIALTIRKALPGGAPKRPVPFRPLDPADPTQAVFGVSVGEEYEIEIENLTGENLAVIVLVDGLNVLAARRADENASSGNAMRPVHQLVSEARPWLFPARSKHSIRGWHFERPEPAPNGQLQFDIHKFVIKELQDSLAGQCGYIDQIAQITVIVYGTRTVADPDARGIGTGAGDRGQGVFNPITKWTIDRDDLRAVYTLRYVEESLIAAAQPQNLKEN